MDYEQTHETITKNCQSCESENCMDCPVMMMDDAAYIDAVNKLIEEM